MAESMTRSAEPELEMVRRAAPFGPPAAIVALLAGALAGGWGVGWSAAIGVLVVTANLVASGTSMAYAARISPTALFGMAMGGFVVRMAVIVAIMFGLNRFGWFSPLAFGLAVVPATLLLLGYEMRLMAKGVGRELLIPPPAPGRAKERLAP
jgi:hypothetical protein